jgi:alkylation response protein AidB-like acyl-CoA dehydrogenase
VDAETSLLLTEVRRILTEDDRPGRLAAELCDAGIDDLESDWALTGAMFTAAGETCGRSTLLDLLVAGPVYREGVRVVLPLPGSQDPPGSPGPDSVVSGVVFAAEGCEQLLVHTGAGAVLVPVGRLTVTRVDGLDPGLDLGVVSGTVDEAAAEPLDGRDWDAVVDLCRRALAHELVGVGQRALDTAMDYVTIRHQFGAPLAALQSVRHRLVDAHVLLEAARAVLNATASDPDTELTAMVVKAAAGQAALAAVAAAQQVCGAMGFTAEFGLHRAVRRAHTLDAMMSGATELETQIGALLAARGTARPLARL